MEEIREELTLENQQEAAASPAEEPAQAQETAGYTPRPKGQVWLARIGLVIFLIIVILYYATMFAGGGK